MERIYVAVDAGPQQTMAAIAGKSEIFSQECNWQDVLNDKNIAVIGTSTSLLGRSIEFNARIQATALGVPVVCIEDFPGNYVDCPDSSTSLLIVENELSLNIYKERLSLIPPIEIIPAIRYEPLRRVDINMVASVLPYRVLWAGQPETDNCLMTLEWLVDVLRDLPVKLLFRAHPRDEGYKQGKYAAVLRAIDSQDVTQFSLDELLSGSVDLVATQFSSVAIEAGFYGVPSICLLFENAGGALMRARTGMSMPPACAYGAAFVVTEYNQGHRVLAALANTSERMAVIDKFKNVYAVNTPSLPLVHQALGRIMSDYSSCPATVLERP